MSTKIACCISGYPSDRILEHLTFLMKYKTQMDFFIFFWDVIDNPIKHKINSMLQPKEILYQKPITFPFDAKFKEPDKNNSKNNAISMFYGISQAQQLRKNYERKINKHYDIVIRFRYDIHLLTDFSTLISNVNRVINDTSIVCPWDKHHIGICDQLWIGRSIIMDKFIDIFSWIKNNINTLFFVNENILYKFIEANNIAIKCIDIKYVLRRSHLLMAHNNDLLSEYATQQTLPWVMSCPEKMEGKYQQYIANKNDSANCIYFLTKQIYCDIPCKILNNLRNKYIHVKNMNDMSVQKLVIDGSNIYTHFFIHPYNAYFVNIIIDNPQISSDKKICLSVEKNKLGYSTNLDASTSQFFIAKKDNLYSFAQNKIFGNNGNICNDLSDGLYLCMNNLGEINTDGLKDAHDTKWSL